MDRRINDILLDQTRAIVATLEPQRQVKVRSIEVFVVDADGGLGSAK